MNNWKTHIFSSVFINGRENLSRSSKRKFGKRNSSSSESNLKNPKPKTYPTLTQNLPNTLSNFNPPMFSQNMRFKKFRRYFDITNDIFVIIFTEREFI